MTIQELFEAYKEGQMDAHYDEQDYQFDPADFNWDVENEEVLG